LAARRCSCSTLCATTLDAASNENLRELVALLAERVETADRQLARVVWTAPARPFFAAAAAEAETRALWGEAPPDGRGGTPPYSDDLLEYYAGAGPA
jgi:hypothetical protein